MDLFARFWTALLLVLSWQKLIQSLGNYAEALAEHGQREPARKYLQFALKLSPRRADLWQTLGNVQADLDNWQAAQSAYEQALKLRPEQIEALNGLGFVALLSPTKANTGETAQRYFQRAYELRRENRKYVIPAFSPLKLKHDLEQGQWLLKKGLLPDSFQRHYQALANWQEKLSQNQPLPDFIELPTDPALEAIWGKNLVYDLPQVQREPVLQTLPATTDPLPQYWDNFLCPEALKALQTFCLNATIWHDGSRRAGYLASTLDDGFNSPLLYQIAEALKQALPEWLGNQRLVYMWAFKCDSEGQGIALHNDSAYLNLNFWITPDDANLDPETGGLLIYPQEPPPEWNFDELRIDQAGIETWLAEHPQTPLRIPYRCNRAVLFHSRLFHASDAYRFKPGYANRRVNITLLFGKKTLKYYPRPTLVPLSEALGEG